MGTDIHSRMYTKNWDGTYIVHPVPNVIENRDYDFFAILTNVCNGYGFAGVSRYEEPIKPITSDRGFEGLPFEVDINNNYIGDHSFGYVTLAELQATKLHHQKVIRTGVVSLADYKMLNGKAPKEWSGRVSGGNTKTINESDVATLEPKKNTDYYVQMSWEDFPFEESIDRLISWMSFYIGWRLPPEEIYFVFGFDN